MYRNKILHSVDLCTEHKLYLKDVDTLFVVILKCFLY